MFDGFTNGPLFPQPAKATQAIDSAINRAIFLMGTFMGEV
jgi:hypothetical protein